jgi:hypothetical protein
LKRPLSILCLAAIVLLGAFDAQLRALAEGSDHLIVPGVRIGPMFIGMTETQLYQKLGDPSKTVRGNDGTWVLYEYKNLGLVAHVNPANHKVNLIDSNFLGEEEPPETSYPYSTREGITVGSSDLKVQSLPWKLLWTKKTASGFWTFAYPGIQIHTHDGVVNGVAVFAP